MKKIKSFLFILLIFFLFWGPRFFFCDFFYLFSFLFSALFISGLIQKKIPLFKECIIFVFLFIPVLLYNLIVAYYYGFKDLSIIYEIFKAILMTLSANYLVNLIYNRNSLPNIYLNKMLFYATVLNSLTVLFTQFIPVVKEKILPMLNIKLATSWEVASGLRSTDWSMGGGTALSIVLFFIALASYNYRKHIHFYKEGLLVITLASFFSGRTGFYLIVVFIAYIMLKHFFVSFSMKTIHLKRASIIRVFLYPLIFVAICMQLANVIDWNILTDKVLPWAFEAFYSYGDSGKVESQTTDILFNDFYFLPLTLLEQLFGSANFGVESDVGFIKIIHASGIFGLLLMFLPFVYLFYCGVKQNNKNIETKLFLSYIIIVLFVNFKELFLMNSRTGFLVLMTFYFLMIFKKRDNFNKNFKPKNYNP